MIDTIWLIPFGMLCSFLGYALCSLMVVSKKDKKYYGVMCAFVFDKKFCNEICNGWDKCKRTHERMYEARHGK